MLWWLSELYLQVNIIKNILTVFFFLPFYKRSGFYLDIQNRNQNPCYNRHSISKYQKHNQNSCHNDRGVYLNIRIYNQNSCHNRHGNVRTVCINACITRTQRFEYTVLILYVIYAYTRCTSVYAPENAIVSVLADGARGRVLLFNLERNE